MIDHLSSPPELPSQDRLGVLTTTLPVVLEAGQVRLDATQIARVAETWANEPWPDGGWDTDLHFFDGTARTLNWLLLLDSLNFCFWADVGQERWQVRWRDVSHNGYNALAAALSRAMYDDSIDLTDPERQAQLSREQLADILCSDNGVFVPLFEERYAIARQTGRRLIEVFDGAFVHAIERADGDAVTLALLIAEVFPSFRDVAIWGGREVRIYKRAQILVADIASAFGGQGYGRFHNLGDLTAFADYKVPQLLRRLGMLDYDADLSARIEDGEHLLPGSPDEVAIRAATIWGVELLHRTLAERGMDVTPAAIDYRLWLAGQIPDQLDRPYHRTRTIFY